MSVVTFCLALAVAAAMLVTQALVKHQDNNINYVTHGLCISDGHALCCIGLHILTFHTLQTEPDCRSAEDGKRT